MERSKSRMHASVLVSHSRGRDKPVEIVTVFGIDAVDRDELLFTLWERMEEEFDGLADRHWPRDATASSPATVFFSVEISKRGG